MPNKICRKCKEIKSTTEFYKHRGGSGGFNAQCKICVATTRKNKDANRTPEEIKQQKKRNRQTYLKNKEYHRVKNLARRLKLQKEDPVAYKAEKRRQNYTPKAIESREKYRKTGNFRASQNKWHKEKYKSDPVWRLRKLVSSRVWEGLKKQNATKRNPTWTVLPYSPQQLKEHLESLFEPWMSWDNYGNKLGNWSIDHIVPHSSFKFDSMDHPDFQKCWALENLRPLDHWENMKKGNRTSKETEDAE